MTTPADFRLEQFRRRRVEPGDVWQGRVVRTPQWVTGEVDHGPYRPEVPMWTSRLADIVHTGRLTRPGGTSTDDVVSAMLEFPSRQRIDWRPGVVEVDDPEVAASLRTLLGADDTEVRVVERLDDVGNALEAFAEHAQGLFAKSSALDQPGVDPDRLRAFAEAAAEFHRAAPWNHLINDDLVQVEGSAPEDMTWMSILGGAGQEFGIGFFPSRESFESLLRGDEPPRTPQWSLTFDPIYEIPLPNADAWSDRDLPVAGPDAYPFLVHVDPSGPSFERADGDRLAFVEGLLRALAATTEDELDAGRWRKHVSTAAGRREFALSLPFVVESVSPPQSPAEEEETFFDRRLMEKSMREMHRLLEGKEFASTEEINAYVTDRLNKGEVPPPRTPKDRAYDLVARAADFLGRMRVKLAREAVRVDRDCTDAWLMLAENMPDRRRRTELYREAVAAGERVLGVEATGGGRLEWGNLDVRPYLRARFALANDLAADGRRDEAIEEWSKLLEAVPDDALGVRWLLVPALVEAGRYDEAEERIGDYEGDIVSVGSYCAALLEFIRSGDDPRARRKLERALKDNPHVPKYLRDAEPPEEEAPFLSPGRESEAIFTARSVHAAWHATPGAVRWLGTVLKDRKRRRKADRKKRTGRGRRPRPRPSG